MKLKALFSVLALALAASMPLNQAHTDAVDRYWLKIKAKDQFERSVVADVGLHIDSIIDEHVYAIGSLEEKNELERLGYLEMALPLNPMLETQQFPGQDSDFHDYDEITQALTQLAAQNPHLVRLFVLGKSLEGRDILGVRISGNLEQADMLPGIFFVGGHHAREHLSVETTLRLALRLVESYNSGDAQVQSLVNGRDLHIVPGLNPDGLAHDIAGGRYKMWRKNRRQNSNGTYGVDLNRNYGYKWGSGGASRNPSSDTYMGEAPFSEPETLAVKNYVEAHQNLTIMLSFHTYSKLILYPWGHQYAGIENDRDRRVHETMAQTMAQWNGYTPQQSSGLYIASGDTTDWAYGEHKMVSFTFELDPANTWGGGGFYPGQRAIPSTVEKNWRPLLYLLEYADNPYRVIDGSGY